MKKLLISRINSFKYAFNGLLHIFKQESNAKIHTMAALAAIVVGFIKHLSSVQWLAVVFTIGLVFITEALNTAIEKLCDFSCDNKIHPSIKTIKDIAAASVLLAAMVSIAVGVVIFFF